MQKNCCMIGYMYNTVYCTTVYTPIDFQVCLKLWSMYFSNSKGGGHLHVGSKGAGGHLHVGSKGAGGLPPSMKFYPQWMVFMVLVNGHLATYVLPIHPLQCLSVCNTNEIHFKHPLNVGTLCCTRTCTWLMMLMLWSRCLVQHSTLPRSVSTSQPHPSSYK